MVVFQVKPPIQLAVVQVHWSVAVGDLNDDGHPDIAVTNWGTSNVGLFIGYGNGSFSYSTDNVNCFSI